MGYAGGVDENPTYHALGDHTECFQVDYDPSAVAYDELLALVWESHNPVRPAFKTQYASVILAHDEEQLAAARGSAAALESALSTRLATRIEPLVRFWPAEDYHQKYYLRSNRVLAAEYRGMFHGDETALRESTAAARVNALVAGHGGPEVLDAMIDGLGLSDIGRSALVAIAGRSGAASGCPIG